MAGLPTMNSEEANADHSLVSLLYDLALMTVSFVSERGEVYLIALGLRSSSNELEIATSSGIHKRSLLWELSLRA